jgi:filamentous hemagglutinin family protein
MIIAIRRYASMGLAVCAIAVWPQVVQAQIIPDGTLPTLVGSQNGLDFAIEDGGRSGNNLFHSFSQFSLPTGGTAIFNNAADVQSIFSRVTGGTVSNIDGLVQAQGSANLFLLNPSGIVFGPNAKLNIGGSFLGTTASRLKFADGMEFSAVNPAPLLTMSVPVGLQLGLNSGSIVVQGSGHTLSAQHPLFAPYIPTGLHGGLAVPLGQTLALIGGHIEFDGGIVTAPEGRVELGSVRAGTVRFTSTPPGLSFNYADVAGFGDVSLKARSLVDVNDQNAGSIQVQGRQVSLTDGSVLWVQNRGSEPAGLIQVKASERLTLQGSTPDFLILSSIVNETVGLGASGNTQILAAQTDVTAGAGILARTYTSAASGAIAVTTQNLTVQGYIPQSPDIVSTIGSLTVGQGNGGNLIITSQQMALQTGGFVGAITGGVGRGGDVQVQADAIAVDGATPAFIPSLIGAATFGQGGDSGNLRLNTRTLSLTNSGFVSTSSIGVGSAGDLVVNASEGIGIGGRYAPEVYSSAISSDISYPTPAYASVFGLTETPRGTAGSVTITTPRLSLWDQGVISTSNNALGDAGTVRINADAITLDRTADIDAFTRSGTGGNVEIQAKSLILRDDSFISAAAGGLGRGGNITLNVGVIVGFKNSDIVANAVQGQGGNIQITTQGILGLQYRDRLTAENDITASSEFGVNGTVQVNTIGVNPNSGLTTLPVDIVDPSQKIATGCTDQTTSSFIATGRGGIPKNPTQTMNVDRVWPDLRDVVVAGATKPVKLAIAPSQLVEATAWQINPQGQPELIDQGMGSMPKVDRISCAR